MIMCAFMCLHFHAISFKLGVRRHDMSFLLNKIKKINKIKFGVFVCMKLSLQWLILFGFRKLISQVIQIYKLCKNTMHGRLKTSKFPNKIYYSFSNLHLSLGTG